jgi:hypothetical protein
MQGGLTRDLCDDMKKTIDSIDEAIQFLVEDSPKRRSRHEVVVGAQIYAPERWDEVRAYAKANVPLSVKTMAEYCGWLEANYPWPLKGDPIPSWRKRQRSLEKRTITWR